jgi:hypothetical protein
MLHTCSTTTQRRSTDRECGRRSVTCRPISTCPPSGWPRPRARCSACRSPACPSGAGGFRGTGQGRPGRRSGRARGRDRGVRRGLTALAARDVHPPGDFLPYLCRPGQREAIAILPAFTGTLVTDALASYTVHGDEQTLCGAHVLRELIAVTEDQPGARSAEWVPRAVPAGMVVRHRRPSILRQGPGGEGSRAGRTTARPRRGVPALHGRLLGPLRQQPGRTGPADSQGAAEDLRILADPDRRQALCPGSFLHLHVRRHGVNPLTALRDLFAGRPWTLPTTS